jgi:Protein of unknown function (DUF3182)
VSWRPNGRTGSVVVHAPDEAGYVGHDSVTRTAVARRLAAIKGFQFAGEYDATIRYPGPVYFVPGETLVDAEAAELGIRSEHDLFGGVVPYAFVGTKAITHPLVEPDACAPAGWSHRLERAISGAVLAGYSAFTVDDARRAGLRLLEHGPARIKPVRATGGRGQSVVHDAAELDEVLGAMDPAGVSDDGLVLEENLDEVTTYSVGQLRVAELVATYYGTQTRTRDNRGAAVYGGSALIIVRGGFDALSAPDLPEAARRAVAEARAYESAILGCFPGLFASRRNYDVAQGFNGEGHWRSGVLEQSWRVGGSSTAEVAALEAFRADPALQAVRAASIEIYGEHDAPPGATVLFRGIDERVGPIAKYSLVEPYGDAR